MSVIIGCAFPGILQPRYAKYTRSLGIEPDVALVEMVPQPNVIAVGGPLVFFGPDVVTVHNCRVDFGSIRLTPAGHVVSVRILDRRWVWRNGSISGRYNVTEPDGTLDTDTEATPQQLAALLFSAMGESGFDVSALPNNTRPFVDWECNTPALELAKLCDALGCRVGIDIANQDRARIYRLGFGTGLPPNEVRTVSFGFDPPEKPGSLELCGGATVFQSKLLMEAIAQETDGEIVPLDDVSYKPSGGWESTSIGGSELEFPNVTAGEAERAMAIASVYRLFRIKSQADGSQSVPGFGAVPSIASLLPIRSRLVDFKISLGGIPDALPSFIQGIMMVGGSPLNLSDTEIDTRASDNQIGFKLYPDSGIVQLSRPAFRLVSGQTKPAELYLTCAYNVRLGKTFDRERFKLNRQISANSTPPYGVRRFDLVETHRAEYGSDGKTVSGVQTNQNIVLGEANLVLDAVQAEFATSASTQAEYRGVLAIAPDGFRQQVGWEVRSGTGHRAGARTFASVSSEFDPGVPRYREKQRIRAALRSEERAERRITRDRSGSAADLVADLGIL